MNRHRNAITPGYEWRDVTHENQHLNSPVSSLNPAINLKTLFPLPDGETLQRTWETRQAQTIETKSGTKIHTMTFNPRALGGTIFWLPGWGVTNRWNGGARVVTSLAALNPDKVIRTADELSHVPRAQKIAVITGDMELYSDNYMFAIDDRLEDLDTLSGHSRGGVIQSHLATRSDMPKLKTINLIDMPRARNYVTAMGFVFRIGIMDNLKNKSQAFLADSLEENLLLHVIPERTLENVPTWMESYDKAQRQWWLLQGLAKEGLRRTIDQAVINQPMADFFLWHGTRNIGAPVKSTRRLIHELCQIATREQSQRIHYFESNTGHYSVGHTARYGRQTTYAINNSSANVQ